MLEATKGPGDPTLTYSGASDTAGNAWSDLQRLRDQQRAAVQPADRLATVEKHIKGLANGYLELRSDIIRGFSRFEHQLQVMAKQLQQLTGKPVDGVDGRSVLHRAPVERDPESVFD